MFFDVRAAKQLKPGQHLVIDGCPGLRLETTATRKTWTYRYKSPADGRMKQMAIGAYPSMTVQEAASRWQALRDQRGTGTDPGQQRRQARKSARQVDAPAEVYTVQR
ncbi:MAG: DUF4102 domain-containing protein, partial [Comamonadaceae bacterium]